MKKRGFTLAEVLITLGIIGVVAALTAPALVMSSRNEANAAKLSVVVSNLENAFNNAIAQEGADNLYGTRMWRRAPVAGGDGAAGIPEFVGNLGRYLVVNGFQDAITDIYDNQGDNEDGSATFFFSMDNTGAAGAARGAFPDEGIGQQYSAGACFPIETKNGAVIFIRTLSRPADLADQREAAINAGCTLYTVAAQVFIDVNGANAPNTFGRDIFGFLVGENGILYPYGSRDTNRVAGGGLWTGGGVFACTDNFKGGDASGEAGLGCTARVIAEGYEMNY